MRETEGGGNGVGRVGASGQGEQTPRRYADRACRKERSLLGHKGRVFDLRWSTAGPSRLASVGEKGGVVWSLDGGAATRTVSFAGTEFMRVCWHPGGAHVLVGDAQGKIAVRAADDGAVSATLDAHAEDEATASRCSATTAGCLRPPPATRCAVGPGEGRADGAGDARCDRGRRRLWRPGPQPGGAVLRLRVCGERPPAVGGALGRHRPAGRRAVAAGARGARRARAARRARLCHRALADGAAARVVRRRGLRAAVGPAAPWPRPAGGGVRGRRRPGGRLRAGRRRRRVRAARDGRRRPHRVPARARAARGRPRAVGVARARDGEHRHRPQPGALDRGGARRDDAAARERRRLGRPDERRERLALADGRLRREEAGAGARRGRRRRGSGGDGDVLAVRRRARAVHQVAPRRRVLRRRRRRAGE